MCLCPLPGLGHKRVDVDVEYAPNTVKPAILVLQTLRLALGLFLHLNSPLHDSFGNAAMDDFQVDYAALVKTNVIEVGRFRYLSLAHNQEPGARFPEAPAPAQASVFLHCRP